MRLVCPNCAATYEVPEDAIPDTGRDVQCASCGHGWYFMRPQADKAKVEPKVETGASTAAVAAPVPEPAPEPITEPAAEPAAPPVVEPVAEALAEPADAPEPETAAEPATDPVAEAEPMAEPAAEPPPFATVDPAPEDAEAALEKALADIEPQAATPDPAKADAAPAVETDAAVPGSGSADVPDVPAVEDGDDDDLDAYEDPAAGVPQSGSYMVDERVLAILREEAEREAQVRKGLAVPLETQADLGVEAAIPDRKPAGAFATPSEDTSARTMARRDLLPNVEEINSTLSPAEAQGGADDRRFHAQSRADERSGFRSGFLLVMFLAIIGTGVYALAPRISAMVPALAGPLDQYIDGVDALRTALDGIMRSATVALNGG